MQHNDRGIIGNIAQHPISFSVTFVVFAFFAISFLSYADALPNAPKATASVTETKKTTVVAKPSVTRVAPKVATVEHAENPVEIKIEKISLDVHIKNPSSTDVEVLDAALLTGAVRYPTSARLGQNGTVLLFGHSSYLPVVHNQAYKAFKGIQTLPKGEVISVYSDTTEYRYSVTNVKVANANEDVIELRTDGKYLTLVTCDSFATKSSRFVVTAKFIGAYPLTSN